MSVKENWKLKSLGSLAVNSVGLQDTNALAVCVFEGRKAAGNASASSAASLLPDRERVESQPSIYITIGQRTETELC